jgi:hypothetical protein
VVSTAHGLRQVRREGGRATTLERAVNDANQASLLRAALMPRWRVDYIGRVRMTLGSVEAPDEKVAVEQAAKIFNIPPARRNKIIVTKISDK